MAPDSKFAGFPLTNGQVHSLWPKVLSREVSNCSRLGSWLASPKSLASGLKSIFVQERPKLSRHTSTGRIDQSWSSFGGGERGAINLAW